jgi:hypothetical protein
MKVGIEALLIRVSVMLKVNPSKVTKAAQEPKGSNTTYPIIESTIASDVAMSGFVNNAEIKKETRSGHKKPQQDGFSCRRCP